MITLRDLKVGASAAITSVGGTGSLRQHFLDMGVLPGAKVTLIKYAPMGDPMELRIHDYELTLRLADAEKIGIQPCQETSSPSKVSKRLYPSEHPVYGESRRCHNKATENPLSKGTVLTFALAGNQNCGKTTLFNQLTGANQHVGNFPGVTVDSKSGAIRGHPETRVTDLPGIYSLSPYSKEEIISRQFILENRPTGIINIVDATNIERNLYLTLQLMELDTPLVLALNMMDEVRGNGGSIDVSTMETILGIPVIPISAAQNEGIDELIRRAIHVAQRQEKPDRTNFYDKNTSGGAVHRCLHRLMHLIEDHAHQAKIPLRFAASKLIEGDSMVTDALQLTQKEKETIEHLLRQMEQEHGIDRSAAIADMRFSFIEKLCRATVTKPKESKEHRRSRQIDQILTGKYTALPVFIGIMVLIFYLTFHVFGAGLQYLLDLGINAITGLTDRALTAWNVHEALHSLIINGIFGGVGSVIRFVPVIVILFFFLSLLEDSGYMARVAFVMDKLLRKIGLSGRSIVPMLIGFGCTVPGVMATRTLSSERDRKMTVLLTPFMSCTAKLPVYGFFAHLFFPRWSGLITVGLYFFGILVAIAVATISKETFFSGNEIPFVMELPNYRLPGAKNVALLLWDKAKDFLQRAFTVIFMASIVVWFLQTFDFCLNIVENSQNSMLAQIAGCLSPIFTPLGFGDWRISTSLIAGFMAKESVVSTIAILFENTASLQAAFSPLAILSLLVFCLLYTPCVAAVASIKRELGFRWALGVVLGQCAIAWICALLVHVIGLLMGFPG